MYIEIYAQSLVNEIYAQSSVKSMHGDQYVNNTLSMIDMLFMEIYAQINIFQTKKIIS